MLGLSSNLFPLVLCRMFFSFRGPQYLQLRPPHGRTQFSASFLRISIQSPPAEPILVHSVLLSKLHKPRKQKCRSKRSTSWALQAEGTGTHVPAGTRCKHASFWSSAPGQREPKICFYFSHEAPNTGIHPWVHWKTWSRENKPLLKAK